MKKIFSLNVLLSILLSFFLIFSYTPNVANAKPSKRPCNCSSAKLPDVKILGGSYGEIISQQFNRKKYDVHHLISRSVLHNWAFFIFEQFDQYDYLIEDIPVAIFEHSQSWAPALLMSKSDHCLTLSSLSASSIAYNRMQLSYILFNSDIITPLELEINFIDKNLNKNHKYDKGIEQVREYIKSLRIAKMDTGIYIQIGGNPFILPTAKGLRFHTGIISSHSPNIIVRKSSASRLPTPSKDQYTQSDPVIPLSPHVHDSTPPPPKRRPPN